MSKPSLWASWKAESSLFVGKFQFREVIDWRLHDGLSLREAMVAEAYADWEARDPDRACGFVDSYVGDVDPDVVCGAIAVYLYSEDDDDE